MKPHWLLAALLWAALDLSGPVLVVPVEAGQEASEEAIGGLGVRRRAPVGLVSPRPVPSLAAGRDLAPPRVVAAEAAAPRPETRPVTVRKLPSGSLDPGAVPDDPH